MWAHASRTFQRSGGVGGSELCRAGAAQCSERGERCQGGSSSSGCTCGNACQQLAAWWLKRGGASVSVLLTCALGAAAASFAAAQR